MTGGGRRRARDPHCSSVGIRTTDDNGRAGSTRSHATDETAPVRSVELDGRRYAVHAATSTGGTVVHSVLADDADAGAGDVLAAAHTLALGGGTDVPLADLPLGTGPTWSVQDVELAGPGPDELAEALLPAWSADTLVDLMGLPAGVRAALAALADLLPASEDDEASAVQKCVARYSREGFEAAAVTAMFRAAGVVRRRRTVRRCTARFARPYAVVATVDTPAGPLPAFSGWITEPVEAG